MAEDSKTYIGLKDLTTADKLTDKRKQLEQMRTGDTREWALNRAFYLGNQWCDYNESLGQVFKLPEESTQSWKVRLSSNQIMPGVGHYVSQMTKTWPTIYATPNSGSERDRKASDLATSLFEYWEDEFALRAKIKSTLVHSQLSQGYMKVTWDPLAGKSMTFLINPETQKPITDDELGDIFRDEMTRIAEQHNLDPRQMIQQFEKTIYVGDIKLESMPGENVLLDPTVDTFEDCKWAICRHAMDPDEVKSQFKKTVEPDSSPSELDTALLLTSNASSRKSYKTTKNVYFGYFRPSSILPKGRYVVWMDDPCEILVDEPWPYPFNELPLVKFPGIERPDSNIDEPRVTGARPMQKELNRFISQRSEFRNLTLRPQMLAPQGSLRQRVTSEPGAVFEYTPIGGQAPDWRPVPDIPASVQNELMDIQARIDKHFNRMPSARDQLPARVDSGNSIELIQEAVADEMSTEIQALEDALVRLGTLMVKLAQKYYIEPRLLKIKGSAGSVQVKKFMNSDIAGGFTFRVETGTGLPRSRAGRQQRIQELAQAFPQLFPPNVLVKYLELGDLKGIEAMVQADEDQAYREHEKLIQGVPIYAPAVQQAMQVVQSGMDPQTNQPLTPQGGQQMLQQAAVQPMPVINPESHIQVHDLLIKSPEFEAYPPDVQERIINHRMAEFQMMMQMMQAQASFDPKVAPKTSVQLRGTLSSPVAAKILGRQGIQTTDQEVAEPPLETIVYDSIDKPNESGAGNAPLDQAAQMAQMQRDQDAHILAMAQAHQTAEQGARSAQLSDQKAQMMMQQSAEQHAMSQSQAEDQHMQGVAQQMQQSALDQSRAEEMHNVKKKVAARPKPSGGSS